MSQDHPYGRSSPSRRLFQRPFVSLDDSELHILMGQAGKCTITSAIASDTDTSMYGFQSHSRHQFVAKPDQVHTTADSFLATYQHEHEIWMVLKHSDSASTFTVFDAADAGHSANELLQSSPTAQTVRIMKTHSKVTIPNTEKTAGAPVGLVLFFKVKPGKADAVRELIFSAIFSLRRRGRENSDLVRFGVS
ncbi:uncharacterized protein BT62DRAFT_993597 [Guyanagaster necrorhizus]|uniref:Uncharacterized protein n=1 Tax=Guyanagaster necrorhizus TaxID=856835 RepID=A0A9P7VVR1_9AGAR|nr:uncharacterized protein BT62DRAFT_993597 [Guyanagaster necrorhizus MCA 3950]KAG7447345.1 hypothetical protein BT62DRAFT_993597 [Guyanagaster necrorhizus MCA 3950]